MSSISVPVAGQVVSVSTFGSPVVNALNAITDGTNLVTLGSATIGGNLSVTGIGQIIFLRKTANETVNNLATLQDDDHLTTTIVNGAVYHFDLRLHYTSGTTPDLKIGWSFPTSTTMAWAGVDSDTAGAVRIAGNLSQLSVPAICGSGTDLTAHYTGIVVAGSSGTFKLQWAQNTLTATNSTIYAGSYLLIRRVA